MINFENALSEVVIDASYERLMRRGDAMHDESLKKQFEVPHVDLNLPSEADGR